MLHHLSLRLLEKSSARAVAAEVEEHLWALWEFWEEEALPLAEARRLTGEKKIPVLQSERDPLFIRYRTLRGSL